MSRDKWLRWLRREALGAALLVLLPVLTAAAALRLEYTGDPDLAGRTRGHDAVWLGHAWVDGLEATPAGTDVLIGLPGYQDETMGHHGYAETVAAAVRGARLALADRSPDRQRFGTALYVDFTATPEDWAAYRAGWGEP